MNSSKISFPSFAKKGALDSSINNMPMGYCQCSKGGKILAVNLYYLKILGYKSKKEAMSSSLPAGLRRQLHFFKRDKKSATMLKLDKKNGHEIWTECQIQPAKDKKRETICYDIFIIDITKRKRDEEILKNSEERLKILFDNAPNGYYLNDLKGNFVDGNKAAEKLSGYKKNELIGKNFLNLKLLSYDQIPKAAKLLAKNALGRPTGPDEFTLNRKNGNKVELEIRTYPVKINGKRVVLANALDITQRKKEERELRQLALAAATVGDAICMTDNEGIIEYVNSALKRLLGYKKNELLGKPVSSLYPGGWKNQNLKQILKTLQKKNWSGEVVLEHKNGDLIPTLETASPLIENGQLQGFVCTNTDITNLKHAEDKIRRHSRQLEEKVRIRTRALIEEIEEHKSTSIKLETQKVYFENLFQTSPDAILILDTSDRIIQVNKSFETIFGYRKDEIKGKKVSDLIVPDGLKRESKRYTKETAKGKTVKFESMRQTKGGDKIHVSIVSSPLIFDKNQLAVYAIYRDISTHKRAVMKLQESENRYRSYYTKTKAMLYSIDINGEVIAVSNYWLKKLGYKRSEVIGHKSVDFLTEESKRYAMNVTLPIFMKKGYANDVSYQFVKRNGEIMDTLLSAVAEYDPKGKFKRSIAVLNDVTERRQAENKLKESQKQLRNFSARIQLAREEERTEVAHEIHDELGQALTALKLDITSLLRELPDDEEKLSPKVRSIIELVDKTTDSVRRISTELRPGILDVLGLIPALEWQSEEFQEKTGIRCIIHTKIKNVKLDKDCSTAVFRILQEALTNVTRHSEATKVLVQVKQNKNKFELIISDNGRGISEEEINNPTSFGLMSMRERLHPWRGVLIIEGTESKGTTLRVKVPINE